MFEEEKKNQAENTTEQSAFYDSPDYARVQGQKERPFDAPYFSQESSSSVQQNGYTDSSRPYYGNPTVTAYQQMHQHYQQAQAARPSSRKQHHMSRAGVITAISICLVLSLALGFGGGVVAVKLFGGQSRTSVIYDAGGSTSNTVLTGDAMSISDVVSSVSDSVVQITTESVTTGSIFGQYISEGAGSGVVLTSDGYIVTNNHVIEDANKITVTLTDGTEYQATLVGTDSETDVAVIKVEAANLKPATLGDSDQLTVGQTAIVIGNPLGSLGGSVTSGIISALDRDVTVNGETMTLLQTSAAVNPGNSGGGLFNANGYLVGIVNAKYTSTDVEGIGFAIPINVAKSVINDLIEYGYVKGRIDTGFSVVDLTSTSAAMTYRVSQTGIYVLKVTDTQSGFYSGDMIVSIDGQYITSMEDYESILDTHAIGDVLEIVVSRNGKQTTVPLTLKEYVPTTDTSQREEESLQGNLYSYYYGKNN